MESSEGKEEGSNEEAGGDAEAQSSGAAEGQEEEAQEGPAERQATLLALLPIPQLPTVPAKAAGPAAASPFKFDWFGQVGRGTTGVQVALHV